MKWIIYYLRYDAPSSIFCIFFSNLYNNKQEINSGHRSFEHTISEYKIEITTYKYDVDSKSNTYLHNVETWHHRIVKMQTFPFDLVETKIGRSNKFSRSKKTSINEHTCCWCVYTIKFYLKWYTVHLKINYKQNKTNE